MKHLSIFAAVILGGSLVANAGVARMSSGKGTAPLSEMSNESGWIVSAVGGPVWFQEITIADSFSFRGDTYRVNADFDFDTGLGGTLGLAYKLNNGFALGLSVGYYTAELDRVEVDVKRDGRLVGKFRQSLEDLNADLTIVPINFNIMYSFPLTTAIYSYVGAGAGMTYSELDSDEIGGGDTWEFGAQGVAGFGFKVSENIGIKLGYRFLYTQFEDESLLGHALEAGVGIKF